MKEINFDKYDAAGKVSCHDDSDGRTIKTIDNWTKRNDHRHHAMDAITIAFTRREHIQILNSLNASENRERAKHYFVPPMPLDRLRSEVKRSLGNALVSIKANNKVATKNINTTKTATGLHRKATMTPRGSLHKEQVYGQRQQYEVYYVQVGARLTQEVISQVASKRER